MQHNSPSCDVNLLPFCMVVFFLALHDILQAFLKCLAHLLWHGKEGPAPARPAHQGSHPHGLSRVGILVTDPADAWLQKDVLDCVIAVLLEQGVQRIVVHDVFGSADLPSTARHRPSPVDGADAVRRIPPGYAAELLLRLCSRPQQDDGAAPVQLAGSSSSVHREFITSQLQAAEHDADLSEMDMILVLGPVFSLAGFPSWQARSSEVFHIDSTASDAASSVQHVLNAYFSTLQRFGV